jgi:hypothetical protein
MMTEVIWMVKYLHLAIERRSCTGKKIAWPITERINISEESPSWKIHHETRALQKERRVLILMNENASWWVCGGYEVIRYATA